MAQTIIKIGGPVKTRTGSFQKWRDETGQRYITISDDYSVETEMFFTNSEWKVIAPCDVETGPPESHDETVCQNGFIIVGDFEDN